MSKKLNLKIDLICIASGPSLTKEDCELAISTGLPVLAVNNSWELLSRCNFLFAGDQKWWEAYADKVPKKIFKITSSKKAAMKHGVNFFPANGPFNSGMRALMWALQNGFRNIVLLGFDCSIEDGAHWHGLHDVKLSLSNPDAAKTKQWQTQFLKAYARAKRLGANVVNCSRKTELQCFQCAALEDALNIEYATTETKIEIKRKTKIKDKTKKEKESKESCEDCDDCDESKLDMKEEN